MSDLLFQSVAVPRLDLKIELGADDKKSRVITGVGNNNAQGFISGPANGDLALAEFIGELSNDRITGLCLAPKLCAIPD